MLSCSCCQQDIWKMDKWEKVVIAGQLTKCMVTSVLQFFDKAGFYWIITRVSSFQWLVSSENPKEIQKLWFCICLWVKSPLIHLEFPKCSFVSLFFPGTLAPSAFYGWTDLFLNISFKNFEMRHPNTMNSSRVRWRRKTLEREKVLLNWRIFL